MNKEEIWHNLLYRMDAEGFHYCFDKYSSWKEIKDEELHKLRLNYLESAKQLQEYIINKNKELNEDY